MDSATEYQGWPALKEVFEAGGCGIKTERDRVSIQGLLLGEWVILHRGSGFEAVLTGSFSLFWSSKTCCNV
jgi:hypothetical protein